jgi:hypothetical protein
METNFITEGSLKAIIRNKSDIIHGCMCMEAKEIIYYLQSVQNNTAMSFMLIFIIIL